MKKTEQGFWCTKCNDMTWSTKKKMTCKTCKEAMECVGWQELNTSEPDCV